MKHIKTPLTKESISKLKAGDKVLLSGTLYTARDAAHERIIESIENCEALPFSIQGQTIYYVGPTPSRAGDIIGSAGPTTSGRMDKFTPALLEYGLSAMIGKGKRSETVKNAIKSKKAVYFAAIGGSAALISNTVLSNEIIAYEDLKSEAIRKLVVKDMPLIVAIDSDGNDYYEIGRQTYIERVNFEYENY